MPPNIGRRIAQVAISSDPTTRISLELPNAHDLAAIDLCLNVSPFTSDASTITASDATLGAISLLTNVQLVLEAVRRGPGEPAERGASSTVWRARCQ